MALDTITPGPGRARRVTAALLASLIASVAIVTPVAAGLPTTRYVDDDASECGGVSPYTTIQAAINASSDGDTILICPGEYVGQFTVLKSDLTIRGVQPWTADIVAPDGPVVSSVVAIAGVSGTLIQWLEIVAPTEASCGKVLGLISVFDAPDTRIRANHLGARGTDTLSDFCGYANGIEVGESDGVVIAWNRIVDFQGFGINVQNSADADIHGNSARFLHAAEPATFNQAMGIRVDASPNARIARNVARSLPSAGTTTPRLRNGIVVRDGGDPRVILNWVSYTRFGLVVSAEVAGGIVRGNAIRRSESIGVFAEAATQGVRFARNVVRSGDGQGIQMSADTSGNVLRHNDARSNALTDCFDESSGPANDWGDPNTNLGLDDSPDGICVDEMPIYAGAPVTPYLSGRRTVTG